MSINVELPEGKYVVAVSGGVDSVVLLDLLTKLKGHDLIVAHFDHGIRKDSNKDCIFVEKLASQHGLKFEYKTAKLGVGTSEDEARQARYSFLEGVANRNKADAVVTAHHQDDEIETVLINLLRGTNRRGLSAIRSNLKVKRPLLDVPKQTIIEYAKERQLNWVEDETNQTDDYLRNYLRRNIIPKLSLNDRAKLLALINKATLDNVEIDKLLETMISNHQTGSKLDRQWVISLPHNLTKEVLAAWLRYRGLSNYDKNTLERLAIAAKTYRAGQQVDVYNGYTAVLSKKYLALSTRDR